MCTYMYIYTHVNIGSCTFLTYSSPVGCRFPADEGSEPGFKNESMCVRVCMMCTTFTCMSMHVHMHMYTWGLKDIYAHTHIHVCTHIFNIFVYICPWLCMDAWLGGCMYVCNCASICVRMVVCWFVHTQDATLTHCKKVHVVYLLGFLCSCVQARAAGACRCCYWHSPRADMKVSHTFMELA